MLDVHDLARRPGAMRDLDVTVTAPAWLGTEIATVREGSEIGVVGRTESVLEGVLLTATLTTTAQGECVRCLDEVTIDLDVPLTELFFYPDRAEAVAQNGEDTEDIRFLEDDLLDLEGLIRDSVVPALPFQPLCRPDCPGLCSQCGARLADDPNHQHETIDPRWSALHGVFQDLDAPTETKES